MTKQRTAKRTRTSKPVAVPNRYWRIEGEDGRDPTAPCGGRWIWFGTEEDFDEFLELLRERDGRIYTEELSAAEITRLDPEDCAAIVGELDRLREQMVEWRVEERERLKAERKEAEREYASFLKAEREQERRQEEERLKAEREWERQQDAARLKAEREWEWERQQDAARLKAEREWERQWTAS